MVAVIFVISIVIGYLIGSCNTSIIISKCLKKSDVRKSGSGNAGASNMVRTYGIKYGVITFVADFFKVVVAFFIARALFLAFQPEFYETYSYFVKVIVSLFCFIGHIYPCFFGFKGGKGITVCAGMIFIIDWRMFIFGATLFLVVMAISKYISLSSVLFALSYPLFTLFLFDKSGYGDNGTKFKVLAVILSAVFSVFVTLKHKENIVRLKNGTENRFTLKKEN